MSKYNCPNCGAPYLTSGVKCEYCGTQKNLDGVNCSNTVLYGNNEPVAVLVNPEPIAQPTWWRGKCVVWD